MKKIRALSAQSLIEFAFIFPLVMALLLGFFDLGRAVFYYSSLSNAVREATRAGIVMDYKNYSSNPATIDNALKDEVLEKAFGLTTTSQPLTADDITISTIKDNDIHERLKISASFCYVPLTPGIMLIVESTCNGIQGIALTAESVMYIEDIRFK